MTVHSNNTPAATPRHIADTAGKRIAPLWPLKTFVAVNPYFGLSDMPFATAAERLARVTGARSTQSRAVYLDAIAQGTITACDLRAARAGVSHPTLPSEPDALVAKAKSSMSVAPDRLPALTDLAGRDAGSDWTAFVTERVSLFAATVFDEGQAAWRAVAQDESLYQGWRLEAVIDRTPDVAGLTGVRAAIRDLPESVDDLLAHLNIVSLA